ncbi:MAG: SprT-like domain-containing protein [Candidatus Eremiobacteraeota bacterium]|nr:SprT-like domain-containing protein [Candidatus Eremiobacteraeota bacterium]
MPNDALPSEADLQLLFARFNYEFFNGEVPGCRIRYNERFSNSAGRTTYGRHPMDIELSPKHFRRAPQALAETLLHEMIHAWCYAKFGDMGHGPRFKRKLRECGLTSIYHELGNAAPLKESSKRFILRCERCSFEVLRRTLPRRPSSCPRCNKRRFDERYPLVIHEIVEIRRIGSSLDGARAARKGLPT